MSESLSRPPPGRIAKLMAEAAQKVKEGRLEHAVDPYAELARAHRLIKALQKDALAQRTYRTELVARSLEGAPSYLPHARAQAAAERIVDLLSRHPRRA